MVAIVYPRKLVELLDVDPTGIAPGDVPTYDGASFTMGAGGGGGAFSLGVSNLGNTLGQTGVTGTRLVLAGVGNLTLSQLTDANGGTISFSGGTVAPSFSGGVSGGNSAGVTGMTGSRLAFVGGQNITLSQVNDAAGGTITLSGASIPPQTVQTQNVHNVTLSGNTAGVMAQISSGTMTLAGGANITLSQAGNAVTIVGQAGGAETQTGISGIANSQTTYSSGTVSLSEQGAITIRSTTGNQFQFSVAPQSVQPETQTFIGGISASDTLYTSGSVRFTGSGNITVLSGTGQRVIISGSQSVQPETQTFVGGIAASNTTYTSGTVTLTGVGGGVTVSSNTGQRIDISVAAPVAQTNQAGSVFAVGNTTSSSSGTYDARTLSLRGDGIISIAATNSGFRISATESVQTQNLHNLTLSGNTAGVMAQVSSGTLTLAGGNGITLSQNGNAVTISGVSSQTGTQFSAGISGGNTSGHSGTVAGRVVLAGGNGITLSGSSNGASETITISAFTQTVQTQNMVAVTLSGNTSGAQALISSGTMTLAGGNNITVSQAGNAVTISGPNVGGAQTGISALANSETTYTSGSVTFSALGALTIRSTTGQHFQFSVNSQTDQTLGMYALGNTTGQSSSTTFDARTVSLRGDGIISLGYSNGSLRISASQSVQPETQTFLGALVASDKTYTSGTITITGTGGGVTVNSNAGQRIDISVAAPVAQTGTQFSAGLSNLGNTAGDTGTVAGRVVLVGSNNITLSGSTNGASQTISILGGAGSGGDTDVTEITQTAHGLSVGDWVRMDGTDYVLAQADSVVNAEVVGVVSVVDDANNFTLITGGLVTGLSGLTAGAVHFLDPAVAGAITDTEPSGDGEVSKPVLIARSTTSGYVFNMRGAVIDTAGITAFLAGISNIGNTVGDTGITGTRLVLAGGNNITLSGSSNASGGTVTISAPTQTVQPGVQQLVASNASFSSGTVSISGFGDITVNTAANIIRISGPVQTAQTGISGVANSQTTYTSGTVSLSELGAITIRSTTGNQYQFSVNSQTAQTQNLHNVTLSGNTAGAMAQISSGTLTLAGGNGITLSQAGNAVTISGVTQSTQPGVQHFVVSNTTFSSGTVSISGFGDVTVNTAANIIRISAPAQTAQTGISGLANSQTTYTSGTVSMSELGAITIRSTTGNQYQFSVNSQTLQTSNVHNVTLSGNTAGAMAQISSGTMTLAGGNGITLSQAGNAVTISGGAGGGFSAGLSNLGNTQGDTGVTGTRLVIVGSDNITISQATDANGGTVSIKGQSPAGGAFSGGVSTGGNTAGATGISGTQMVLVGSGVMSLSQTTGANGNTVSILGPATSSLVGVSGISISTNGSTISIMQTTASAFLTSLAPYDESPVVTGQQGQGSLHLSPLRIPEGLQFDRMGLGVQYSNASNSSGSMTLSNWVGLYTRNVSTISLLASTSISTNFTGSGTVGSYSLFAGPRWQTIGWTTTLTEGDYYIGIISRTTSGGANMIASQLLLSKFTNSAWSGMVGVSTGATDQRNLGQGHYSATTSSLPASIAFTQIRGTASEVLRTPIFMFRSGTV